MQERLSDRKSIILKYLIQEYVRTGRAVGSKTLIDRFQLGVSPATVRNEMGDLEELALLQHMHTSAGRIPTDLGYRYYVEYLMDEALLPVADQIMIRHQFGQVETHVDSWLKLAATILADISGNLALVTPPRSMIERLRHVELISLRDQVGLLIVVTQSGGVHERILTFAGVQEQEDLSELSRNLNTTLRNLSHEQILARVADSDVFASFVIQNIAEALQNAEQESQSEVFSEGLDRALQQPELAQSPVAQRLLELLRGGAILAALLPQLELEDDVQVFIGSENQSADLRPFGVIVGTYGTSQEITGLLGVVGPTRMAYSRSISSVRYLSKVLSDMLGTIYDSDSDETRISTNA